MADLISKDILPAVSKYTAELCRRAELQKGCGLSGAYELSVAAKASGYTEELMAAYEALQTAIATIPEGSEEAMVFCRDSVITQMNRARAAADALEGIVDHSFWPFPTYVDLLFSEG